MARLLPTDVKSESVLIRGTTGIVLSNQRKTLFECLTISTQQVPKPAFMMTTLRKSDSEESDLDL